MKQTDADSQFSPELNALLADYLNGLSERDVMMAEHKYGRATLVELLAAVQPAPIDPFHEALFSYVADGAAGIMCWHLLPNLAQYEQLRFKDEWDEEAINLASRADVPWQCLVAKFGNRAEVWQAVDLSPDEVLENIQILIDAGVNMEPYIAKLETLCECGEGVRVAMGKAVATRDGK